MHPEDRDEVLRLFIEIIRSQRQPRDLEFRGVRKDGNVIYLASSPTRLVVNGKKVGFQAIIVNITEHKRAEKALFESQQKFERLFMGIPEATVYWDPTFHVLDVNPSFTELFGYPLDEIRGKDSTSFIVPKNRIRESNIWGRKAKEGYVDRDTVRKRKDGSLVPVSMSVAPMIIDGQLVGYVGLYKDITRRKKTEEELLYQANLLQNVSDAIIATDQNFKIKSWNKASEKIYGWKEDEVIDKKVRDVTKLECPHDNQEEVLKQFLKEGYWRGEVTQRHKNGKTINVLASVSLIKDRAGNSIGAVAVNRDITERKKAEEVLRESEERYRALFEQAPVGIDIATSDAIVIDANQAMQAITGYSKEELKINLSGTYENPEQRKALLESARQHGAVVNFPVRLKRKNGNLYDALLNVSSIHIGGKSFLQTICQDVTERKKAEEALLAERDRLETVTRNIGAGLAIISKDYHTLWANDVLKQMFGDVECKICYSTYNQRNEMCPRCGVREIFETGKDKVVHEQVGKDVDGKTVWSEITATPIKDKDGNITSVLELVVPITDRKQLEEAIKENQERLKNIFAASPDAITVSDSNGNIIECNQATLDMLGFSSKEELIGKNGYELIAKKDHQKAKEYLKKTLEQGSVRNIEFTFLTEDGHEFPAELSASVIKHSSGKFGGFVSITKNITERKNVEEALRESERKFRLAFENAKDAIFWADPETGLILNCNRAAEILLEEKREKIIGQHQMSLHPPQKAEYYADMFKKHIEQKGAIDDEAEVVTKSGKTKPVYITASTTLVKGKPLIQGIFRDITERKKAEEELRKFKTISDKAGYGSAISDLEGSLTYVNESFAEMHGYTADELISKNLSIFHTKVQMKNVARLKERLKQKGNYVAEEVWHRKKDNTVFPALMNGTLIRDEEGKPLFMAATAVDITERKQMEDELRRYSEHLEELVEERTRKLKEAHEQLLKTERLATIGELATMVAHDLRNPLTSIRNAGFYIKNSCPARATGECKTALEMLDIINQEIIFANNIINDLLDFAAKRPLQRKRRSINKIIECLLTKSNVPENIEVQKNFPERAIAAVDEKQLERVFLNLIKNAVQAMPNGGKLAVATTKTKDHVEIAFTDTGTGIAEEKKNKIFTPLFTTKAKGIGMGLAICKRIIEEHGGTIDFRSRVDQGTTFTIKLPKNKRASDQ